MNKGWFQSGTDPRRGGFEPGHVNYKLPSLDKQETRTCLECQNEFTGYKSNHRIFCSNKCRLGFRVGKAIPWLNGKNHWNWRGGISNERDRDHQTSRYRSWRSSVFERDDYTCQFCGIRGGDLEADHIKPWAYFKDLRYSIDNGRTLCFNCHKKTDTYGIKATRLYLGLNNE